MLSLPNSNAGFGDPGNWSLWSPSSPETRSWIILSENSDWLRDLQSMAVIGAGIPEAVLAKGV